MRDIMDAFNSEQLEGTKYDFSTDNCAAGLLINMMRHLGNDATARNIITFVSHHLSNYFKLLKHYLDLAQPQVSSDYHICHKHRPHDI